MSAICTLLHISDLHFGGRYAEVMGDAVQEAAERIRPDVVVASGDLVDWAERTSAWHAVSAFLRRFRAPVLTVPGNHDIERANLLGRFARPFRAYRRHVHEEIDRAVTVAGAHLIGMCSPSRWTVDLGYVSRRQVEWAQDGFARAEDTALRVLVVHHGVRPLRRRIFRNHLRGARLERPLLDSGVDLVLTGHLHFPHAEQLTRADGEMLLWAQAGSATCARFHPRHRVNSFSVVRARVDRIDVSWWHYDPGSSAFRRGEELTFPRRRPVALLPGGSPGLHRAPG